MDADDSLEYYLEIGAIEIVGIEEDGEFLFKMTEKAKELAPELWEAHASSIDALLLDLYDKGLINVSYNENLEATIDLTPQGFKMVESYGFFEFPE